MKKQFLAIALLSGIFSAQASALKSVAQGAALGVATLASYEATSYFAAPVVSASANQLLSVSAADLATRDQFCFNAGIKQGLFAGVAFAAIFGVLAYDYYNRKAKAADLDLSLEDLDGSSEA